jgi:hypothetical protein
MKVTQINLSEVLFRAACCSCGSLIDTCGEELELDALKVDGKNLILCHECSCIASKIRDDDHDMILTLETVKVVRNHLIKSCGVRLSLIEFIISNVIPVFRNLKISGQLD